MPLVTPCFSKNSRFSIHTHTTQRIKYSHHDWRNRRILATRLGHHLPALPLLLVGEPCKSAVSGISGRLRDGRLSDHVDGIGLFRARRMFAALLTFVHLICPWVYKNNEQGAFYCPSHRYSTSSILLTSHSISTASL